jgi:hypothetical protein
LTNNDLTEKEEAILPTELFREKIIPILINIFHVREMQIRLVLLNFFPNYVGMFTYGFLGFFAVEEFLDKMDKYAYKNTLVRFIFIT